ncbi:MAG: beta strand repeat-containing protein, partial [Akkermansiaceae bacterium]
MKICTNLLPKSCVLSLASSCLTLFGSANAATFTWDGGGGDSNWSTAANWDPNVAPVYNNGAYDTLYFDGSTGLTANNDRGDGDNIDSIIFASTAGAFTLTGGSLDMLGRDAFSSAAGTAEITNNSANTQTINNNLINRKDLNTSLVFNNTAGGNIVVNGAITEQGGDSTLSKIGGGTLELTGTGNTAYNMNAAGGNLILSGTSTTTVSNNLLVANSGISGGGAGTLTVQDSATLTSVKLLVGNQAGRNGTVNQTGGTVNLTGSGAADVRIGHWSNLTGTYNLSGGTLNTLNTDMILGWDSTGILNVDGGTANLKGIRYGWGNSPSRAGTLNLNAGTLNIGSNGMAQEINGTINLNGGTLGALDSWSTGMDMNLNGSVTVDTSTNNIDLSGDIAGTGTLTKLGTGALTLTGTGNTAAELNVARGGLVLSGNSDTTVSGNMRVSWGNTSFGAPAGGGYGTLTIQDNAALTVNGAFTVGQTLSTNGLVTQTGGTVNLNGGVTIAVWSNLTGTYTISGGSLNVLNNVLTLGHDGQGVLNIDGGVVNAKGIGHGTGNNGARAGTINLDGGTLNVGATGMYQEINGTVNLNSGTLGSLASWSTGMGMNLGGAVDIDTTGGDISMNGALAGTGGFTKKGTGTLNLSGANTYSGTTTVSGGTLSLASGFSHTGGGAYTVEGGTLKIADGVSVGSAMTIGLGGVISPGNSPGTAATGSQTWLDGGSYLWEVNASGDAGGTQGADPGWDWLDITGTLDLSNLTAGGFTIDIDSLTASNLAGDAVGFDTWTKGSPGDVDYSFTIATASAGITGFDAANFLLDSSGFSNAPSWDWQIVLSG